MKGHRQVQGLLAYAKRCARPDFIPQGRPRGAKASGIAYEEEVARALGAEAARGTWFEFCDAKGTGWCQTDFILVRNRAVFVIEAKLSWVPEAQSKLRTLYLPVVERALERTARGIIICKYLGEEAHASGAHICSTLDEALSLAPAALRAPILHFNPKIATLAGLAPQKMTRARLGGSSRLTRAKALA